MIYQGERSLQGVYPKQEGQAGGVWSGDSGRQDWGKWAGDPSRGAGPEEVRSPARLLGEGLSGASPGSVSLCLQWSALASRPCPRSLSRSACLGLTVLLAGLCFSGSPALRALLSLAVWVCLWVSGPLHLICVWRLVPSTAYEAGLGQEAASGLSVSHCLDLGPLGRV